MKLYYRNLRHSALPIKMKYVRDAFQVQKEGETIEKFD